MPASPAYPYRLRNLLHVTSFSFCASVCRICPPTSTHSGTTVNIALKRHAIIVICIADDREVSTVLRSRFFSSLRIKESPQHIRKLFYLLFGFSPPCRFPLSQASPQAVSRRSSAALSKAALFAGMSFPAQRLLMPWYGTYKAEELTSLPVRIRHAVYQQCQHVYIRYSGCNRSSRSPAPGSARPGIYHPSGHRVACIANAFQAHLHYSESPCSARHPVDIFIIEQPVKSGRCIFNILHN